MTESDYMAALGKRITAWRTERRMSQRELADNVSDLSGGTVHMTQNMLSRVELGRRALPLVEGVYLARALGATIEGLAGVEAEPCYTLADLDADDVTVCPRCGATVHDQAAHDDWHRQNQATTRLDELTERLAVVERLVDSDSLRRIQQAAESFTPPPEVAAFLARVAEVGSMGATATAPDVDEGEK